MKNQEILTKAIENLQRLRECVLQTAIILSELQGVVKTSMDNCHGPIKKKY